MVIEQRLCDVKWRGNRTICRSSHAGLVRNRLAGSTNRHSKRGAGELMKLHGEATQEQHDLLDPLPVLAIWNFAGGRLGQGQGFPHAASKIAQLVQRVRPERRVHRCTEASDVQRRVLRDPFRYRFCPQCSEACNVGISGAFVVWSGAGFHCWLSVGVFWMEKRAPHPCGDAFGRAAMATCLAKSIRRSKEDI